MGLREDKKRKNKESILESARKIFREKGFYQTSISDIIRETGLSRSTFYLYFENKEEIFSTLASQLYLHLLQDLIQLNKIVKLDKENFKQNLKNSLISLFKTLYQHQDLLRILIQSPLGINPDFDKIVIKYQKIFNQAVMDILERGEKYKLLNFNDIHFASIIIYGAIKEIVINWSQKEMNEKEIEEQSLNLILILEKGILK